MFQSLNRIRLSQSVAGKLVHCGWINTSPLQCREKHHAAFCLGTSNLSCPPEESLSRKPGMTPLPCLPPPGARLHWYQAWGQGDLWEPSVVHYRQQYRGAASGLGARLGGSGHAVGWGERASSRSGSVHLRLLSLISCFYVSSTNIFSCLS